MYAKICHSEINQRLEKAKNFSEATDIITDSIWGQYILILDDANTLDRLFMSDPLYSVRLYYRADENGNVRVDTCAGNLLEGTSVDWNLDYLVEFAATQFGLIGETPFSQIKVIPPGCALIIDIRGQHFVKRVWHPKPACGRNTHSIRADAINHVYSRIAASHPDVCAAISGGVDSSSGAIFLRRALGPDIPLRAIHLFSTSSPEANERSMAMQVADSIGAELTCIDVDGCLPFSDMVATNPPSSLCQDMLFLQIDKAISRAIGSSVVLEGQGGDLLFNAVPDAQVVLDAWRDRGWSFAFRTSEKLAMLHNDSIPRILLMAARIAARRRLFRSDPLAAKEIVSTLLRPLHRDASSERSLCDFESGEYKAHFSLHELECFASLMTPVTDLHVTRRINPFLTQPIVEAALNIKSYDSFDCRNDRTVLRKIAHDITPVNVLWRRTKGTFDVGFIKGIQSNHDAFCELVHNGVLMQAGRVDELEFKQALEKIRVGQSEAAISLALLGCVEIFCASWRDFLSTQRVAAD